MESKIVAIGNSKGIIIPSHLLKSLNISHLDKIEILKENNTIVIKPILKSSRDLWERQIKKELRKGNDKSLVTEVLFNDEKLQDEWTW